MTWVKLTDVFPEDPRVSELSHRAFRLHVTALCYCSRNLTDGHVTGNALRAIAGSAGVARSTVADLLSAGLWAQNGDGGYLIPKFLDYNPSAEQVRADREQARLRMQNLRKGRRRS